MRNSYQAGAAQDSKPKFGSFNDSFLNANCSPADYNKMVMCQNNLIEVADKCYDSCRDEICQLKCSEDFYKSIKKILVFRPIELTLPICLNSFKFDRYTMCPHPRNKLHPSVQPDADCARQKYYYSRYVCNLKCSSGRPTVSGSFQ